MSKELYTRIWIILTPVDGHSWHQVSTYNYPCSGVSLKVLTFRIGNHPAVQNPSPAVEAVQVHFICAHPASMSVTPVYTVPPGAQPCPLPQHNKQLVSRVFPTSMALCLPCSRDKWSEIIFCRIKVKAIVLFVINSLIVSEKLLN